MEFLSTLLSFVVAMGAALTLFVGNLVTTYTEGDTLVSITPPTQQASTTPLQPPATEEKEEVATSTTTSVVIATPTVLATSSTTPAPTPSPTATQIDPAVLNTAARGALVNILCLTKGGGLHPASGSGVFVDKRGVVLTNAHVGQYFLLKDYPTDNDVDCTVRTGSPAVAEYHARLLYLPTTWIQNNAAQIDSAQAKGTGEDDYAFLLVTNTTNSKDTLPTDFPALPMTIQEPHLNETTLLAAYPAGFLDGISIQKNLYATTAYAAVKDLFTFASKKTIDLVSIGGTVVSQGGSSGGATIRISDGRLQGIIATATSADTTAGRDLRAITLAHINRSLATQGKTSIEALLSQDLSAAADDFEAHLAPAERSALIKALK